MNAPCPAETLESLPGFPGGPHPRYGLGTRPRCAAVYYVHRRNRFYFSPAKPSRHVTEALPGGARCAASVSAGGGADWREIRGAQMEGAVTRVGPGREWFGAAARFLLKFPFAKAFLKDPDIRAFRRRGGRDVHLYRFEASAWSSPTTGKASERRPPRVPPRPRRHPVGVRQRDLERPVLTPPYPSTPDPDKKEKNHGIHEIHERRAAAPPPRAETPCSYRAWPEIEVKGLSQRCKDTMTCKGTSFSGSAFARLGGEIGDRQVGRIEGGDDDDCAQGHP